MLIKSDYTAYAESGAAAVAVYTWYGHAYMLRVFLAANAMERISVCMCAVRGKASPQRSQLMMMVGVLSRDTLWWLELRHGHFIFWHITKLPQGGHSHSCHHQEIIKVPSDSSHELADDKNLLALEVIPMDCQNSKGAAAALRCGIQDICSLGEIK